MAEIAKIVPDVNAGTLIIKGNTDPFITVFAHYALLLGDGGKIWHINLMKGTAKPVQIGTTPAPRRKPRAIHRRRKR